MTRVTVPLTEQTYKRVKKWADFRQQEIGEAIADYLTNALPELETYVVPPSEPDSAVQREKEAYIRMHPQLKETHFNKYVAIYDGELVDEDDDYGALFERIDAAYPDKFVWMTKVEEEPIKTLYVRSFLELFE